uniref:Uncharacterized protein n=1 Tax=Myotis myotis TaxID=51298 RepID=A0A7J7QUQ2_MYOMY|nr:hypothetical protein mMyoMyo1_011555 [Myotis myotis]
MQEAVNDVCRRLSHGPVYTGRCRLPPTLATGLGHSQVQRFPRTCSAQPCSLPVSSLFPAEVSAGSASGGGAQHSHVAAVSKCCRCPGTTFHKEHHRRHPDTGSCSSFTGAAGGRSETHFTRRPWKLYCGLNTGIFAGSVAEHRPMNQEVTVRFPVRAHAQVAGSIPSVGPAGGS